MQASPRKKSLSFVPSPAKDSPLAVLIFHRYDFLKVSSIPQRSGIHHVIILTPDTEVQLHARVRLPKRPAIDFYISETYLFDCLQVEYRYNPEATN